MLEFFFTRDINSFITNCKRVSKILVLVLLSNLIYFTSSLSAERSEKEKKLGVFKEDLKFIGEFKTIEKIPKELFPESFKTFTPQAGKAQKEVQRIFVDQKGLLDKALKSNV